MSLFHHRCLSLIGLLLTGQITFTVQTLAEIQIERNPTTGGQALLDEGRPLRIKGAGGHQHLALLAEAGGNAIRTWGVDEGTGDLLDQAHRHGLKVAVGIWLGHARHGFDYGDPAQVREQFEKARTAVETYKDHPAVLLWGVGNEMEEYGETTDPRVWEAVNAIASMIGEVDPDHPTMTVIAEVGGDKLASIGRYCPDVDIVGINSYGGVRSLPQRYAEAGLKKPYIVTEFGPPGTWEIGRNDWGVPIEPTSTEKADIYREAYAVLASDPNCLGSFAFLWGNKQEATSTWFGLLLPGGERLGGVDALAEAWDGQALPNRSPRIEPLSVIGDAVVSPGQKVDVTLRAQDPEGDPLRVRWELLEEMREFESAGDYRPTPPSFADAIVAGDLQHAVVQMPEAAGNYRLFAYVYDDHGGAAVANVPLRVEASTSTAPATGTTLPFTVYDEGEDVQPFVPSGYMGSVDAIAMDPASAASPKHGRSCLRVSYRLAGSWGGVAWQSPANDWGDREGGLDLTGATRLRFWARGERGGEEIKFGYGLIGRDKPFYDSSKSEMAVTLTSQWKAYEIPLSGKDLSRIKTGFFWSLAGQGQPMTFYLDQIQYLGDGAEPQ